MHGVALAFTENDVESGNFQTDSGAAKRAWGYSWMPQLTLAVRQRCLSGNISNRINRFKTLIAFGIVAHLAGDAEPASVVGTRHMRHHGTAGVKDSNAILGNITLIKLNYGTDLVSGFWPGIWTNSVHVHWNCDNTIFMREMERFGEDMLKSLWRSYGKP